MPQNTPTVNQQFWSRVEVCSVPVLGQDDTYRAYWNTRPASECLHTFNPDWNNYFCVSLMDTPGVRRKANFVALHVLALDDVGPKIDPDKALKLLGTPTYQLETSPGNQQWGYVLDPPITGLARAEALINNTIKALVGNAPDPGMAGVTRLMRLPIGSNTKYTPAFKCRMVRTNGATRDPADLERDIPVAVQSQIQPAPDPEPFDPFDAAAPGPAPVPGPAPGPGPNRRPVEPTLRAMRKLGMVLGNERKASQGTGWDVRCPWVHEHTPSTAVDTGTMYFRGGGFRCWHGHCQDRKPEDVRRRVNEILSDETGGLFTIDDFDPSKFDAVDPDKAPSSPLSPDPAAVAEFWDSIVFLAPDAKFVDLRTGTEVTERTFNLIWTAPLRDYLPPNKKGDGTISPAQWFFRDGRGRVMDRRAWAPGMPKVYTEQDPAGGETVCMNKWNALSRPLKHVPDDDLDVYIRASDWWLLVDLLCGTATHDQRENARRLRVFMAMVAGAVEHKPGWVPLLIGKQGVGKELIWAALMKVLGPSRATSITQGQLTGAFNPWMMNKLVQLAEMRRTTRGTTTDHDQYTILKRVCDVGREWDVMNDKHEKMINVRNAFALVITSNEPRPLSLPDDDRRVFVVLTEDPGWPNTRYFDLAKWMDAASPWGETNAHAIVEWLIRFWDEGMMLDEMQGHAPRNPDKLTLIERGAGPIDEWLRQTLGRVLPDHLSLPDIFTAGDIVDRLSRAVRQGGEGLSPQTAVPSADSMGQTLSRVGCHRLRNGDQIGARKLRLWVKPNADVVGHDAMSNADLLYAYGVR
jgi:Family of unknown function (DUF5906)